MELSESTAEKLASLSKAFGDKERLKSKPSALMEVDALLKKAPMPPESVPVEIKCLACKRSLGFYWRKIAMYCHKCKGNPKKCGHPLRYNTFKARANIRDGKIFIKIFSKCIKCNTTDVSAEMLLKDNFGKEIFHKS